jgi:hypothetical protein
MQEYPTIISTGFGADSCSTIRVSAGTTTSVHTISHSSGYSNTVSPGPGAGLGAFSEIQDWTKEEQMLQRRIVQVFIVDQDERVSLDQVLLYRGEQELTDATDRELFFEIDVKDLLECHNEQRAKILDKEASARSGRDVYLKPTRIRDLKMVVVTVATF